MPIWLQKSAFWLVLVALMATFVFRIVSGSRDEEHANPALAARSGASERAKLRESAAPEAVSSAPSAVDVALAQHGTRVGPVLSPRRWSSDDDFTYVGHWEHVRGVYDGRSNGSSSRSFRPGASASLTFRGRFVALYGVVGPGGGYGVVDVDGRLRRVVGFFAPSKAVHEVIFRSPPLAPGIHRLRIAVMPYRSSTSHRGQYVNIGGAEYGS